MLKILKELYAHFHYLELKSFSGCYLKQLKLKCSFVIYFVIYVCASNDVITLQCVFPHPN